MAINFTSALSRAFGVFASKEFNSSLQHIINRSYVKLMGLDMSNFAPVDSYKSLKDLFIRELKVTPVVDASITSVVSPCDAKIVDFGKIKDGKAHQIKGMSYDTNSLIGAQESSRFLEGGDYVNFYLSPKDYHRYHMPFDVKVLSTLYIPGKLYPVNMPLLKNKKNLYLENERVVVEVLDRFNHRHFIVLVGALNVGKMVVVFEPNIKTNACSNKVVRYSYNEPIELKKGELFGWFEMGSTIVILSEKDAIEWSVELNQKVSFGDILGELKDEY